MELVIPQLCIRDELSARCSRHCAYGHLADRWEEKEHAGALLAQVEVDHMELLKFIMAGWAPMNEMCEQADLSERAIYDRSKAIMNYYHLPFDVPPPR